MPPRDFLTRRRRNRPNRRDREEEMRHTDLPPSFDVEAEVLRDRAFELLADLTMDDVNALADAGIPGISFPEEGLLSDKIGEIIEEAASQGRAGDLLPNPQDFDFRGPDFNGNLEKPPYAPNGPLPSLESNGTPPHLLDPSTPSPLLLLFDPVGEISPEQVANDIVTGAVTPAPDQDTVHAVGDALGAAVTDQAGNFAAQNPETLRHVDVAALPPEEQARLIQALSGAGQGVSHSDQAVGGDPLGVTVPPHSDPYNRALGHHGPEQAQRHVRQANTQRHALGNPGTEFLPSQQANGLYPTSQMPAPPSTGNPIADRAIQLAQSQFQQPNGFLAGAFDHAGLGQQVIAETLERLTGRAPGFSGIASKPAVSSAQINMFPLDRNNTSMIEGNRFYDTSKNPSPLTRSIENYAIEPSLHIELDNSRGDSIQKLGFIEQEMGVSEADDLGSKKDLYGIQLGQPVSSDQAREILKSRELVDEVHFDLSDEDFRNWAATYRFKLGHADGFTIPPSDYYGNPKPRVFLRRITPEQLAEQAGEDFSQLNPDEQEAYRRRAQERTDFAMFHELAHALLVVHPQYNKTLRILDGEEVGEKSPEEIERLRAELYGAAESARGDSAERGGRTRTKVVKEGPTVYGPGGPTEEALGDALVLYLRNPEKMEKEYPLAAQYLRGLLP